MSPVLPAERIAYLSYGRSLLRCGISVRPMSQMGHSLPIRWYARRALRTMSGRPWKRTFVAGRNPARILLQAV